MMMGEFTRALIYRRGRLTIGEGQNAGWWNLKTF